jgi:hypothetical protein
MASMVWFSKWSAKHALGSLIVFMLTMAVLEFSLAVASSTSKTARVLLSPGSVDPSLPDPVLGFRLNPDVPDHDEAGFRNASAVRSADLVALGDSQTYGTGVGREQAWPQQLSALSGQSTYNMGVPGYGPVHELVLMRRATTLHPRWVIEAFYSGNDLYDAYNMVYTRHQVRDLRSTDQAVLSAIEKAETESSLDQTMDRLFQVYIGAFDLENHQQSATGVRQYLSEHSKLWGLLRATRRVVLQYRDGALAADTTWSQQVNRAQRSNGLWKLFERGSIRTVLVPEYRLSALKMEDIRIHEGLRISVEALTRMASITEETGARFTIVLIPTKELVFYDTFGGGDGALPAIAQLAQEEQKMWSELKREVHLKGVSYIDMLPALRESLSVGDSPYPIGADGHPNAQGHKVIAATVWSAIAATQ